MSRGFRRGLVVGAVSGLAAVVVAGALRPRGGTAVLLDWDEVTRLAMGRLREERASASSLARAGRLYNRLAAELRAPLLEAVGGLPRGASLPDFQALDRAAWLELNVAILKRVMEPLAAVTQVPDSWLAAAGRAGLNRYVALLLEFLGRRVLGQFDPQLLGREPIQPALYLVEPNVAAWERQQELEGGAGGPGLPVRRPEGGSPSSEMGDDLRRWLILHEMTHAWQFAAHPWLRDHMNRQVEDLVALGSRTGSARGLERVRVMTIGVPAQWDLVRRMQATMSLIEGHGNLIMNLVGRRVLPSFDELEAAYRRRSGERGLFEQLVWRLTGLQMKMEQYRVGERFARAVHDRHGMEALNRAWESPETLPRLEELGDPDAWYRRVAGMPRR